MGYECKIIADSLAPNGCRLTTFQLTYPRCIHSEIMTHRAFSRNSASSRAIPVEKMIKKVEADPFIPIYWGKNQKGMQAAEELDWWAKAQAEDEWKRAARNAVTSAKELAKIDAHKQITNRLLEPFLWHTAIISATDYANFFAQRCHPDAQPEIRRIAEMMRDAYDAGEPKQVEFGYWHCPYITDEDSQEIAANWEMYPGYGLDEVFKRVSAARCARVSYLTQEGKRDVAEDIALYTRLVLGSHLSPFEHIARAGDSGFVNQSGNFRGWSQFRKEFPNENRTEYPHAE